MSFIFHSPQTVTRFLSKLCPFQQIHLIIWHSPEPMQEPQKQYQLSVNKTLADILTTMFTVLACKHLLISTKDNVQAEGGLRVLQVFCHNSKYWTEGNFEQMIALDGKSADQFNHHYYISSSGDHEFVSHILQQTIHQLYFNKALKPQRVTKISGIHNLGTMNISAKFCPPIK